MNHEDQDYIHPLVLASRFKTFDRRFVLGGLGALGLGSVLFGCGQTSLTSAAGSSGADSGSGGTSGGGGTTVSSCSTIPTETEGPYPSKTVLNTSSVYRSNILTDIGGSVARTGVPLMLTLNLLNTNSSCAALSNAAVYVWHCDKDGNYSGYNSYSSNSFLRGVQTTDANGQVSFTTIYPGWYTGRVTHVHFEVFLNNNIASTPIKISQIAFPAAVTSAVSASSLYAAKGQNSMTNEQDGIFSDGYSLELASLTGSVSSGYVATLNVGVPG